MKNKKTIVSLSVLACVFLFANYTVYKTSGAHPGSTGAPGDLTCAQTGCHFDAFVIENPNEVDSLMFSASDSTYAPSQTYTITLRAKKAGYVKFGFEMVALKDADSTNTGQFIITDPTRTQIIDHLYGTDTRYSVTHKTAGTTETSPNTNQWTFNWTAPPVSEGPITFYYAINCTNNNGENTGDRIYLSSFTIKALPTSIKEFSEDYELRVFYDADEKNIRVNYDLKGSRDVQMMIFDNSGKLVHKGPLTKLSGKQKNKISLGSDYAKGTYLVQLKIDNSSATKKIVVY